MPAAGTTARDGGCAAIPRRVHLRDSPWDRSDGGISHHCSFAFSLPVEFYEVGVHRVIVGDEDSDLPDVLLVVPVEQD
jgi:hypothetical protein